MNTIRKWIFKPLLILTISVAVLMAIVFIVLSTQQQRLVNIAIRELNRHVKGELIIENSRVSLFRHFPYLSLALHDGRFFPDKTRQGAPLCEFERLYIGFSIPELLHERYDIKILYLNGGKVNIVQEKSGKINLLDVKAVASDTLDTRLAQHGIASTLEIHLNKIVLRETTVSFHDRVTNRRITTHIAKVASALKMDSSRITFAADSDMKLDVISDSDTTFFRNKKILMNIAANYALDSQLFEIDECKIQLQEASFNISGHASFSDTTDVDFRIKGDKHDFSLMTAFLPAHIKEKLKPFQYDGQLYFDALVRGKVSDDQLPLMEVLFACEDAWFLNTDANKKLDQLGFRGFYTNGRERSLRTSEFQMMNVSARPEKGIFRGHFAIRDFTKPRALVQINSELELKFLGDFLGIHDLRQMTGTIKLDMLFRELKDIRLPEESLNKLKEGVQSRLSIKDLSFSIPGYPHAVKDMNIHAEMKDGRVTVDSAYLKIGASDLAFNGSISDVRAFLRNHEKTIQLAISARSSRIMLADLLSHDSVLSKTWNEEISGFNVGLRLETTVHELLNPSPLPKGTFEMKNLRGTFKNYPHTFRDLGATVLINDTLLRLRDFAGMIDSSDINFRGRVINYQLWFADVKKGKTQLAFDFKSNRFAMRDVLGREIRKYIPRGYRREELTNVWLRAKIDLRYDTVFRFAKGRIANVTADLKKHQLKLTEISGGFKYGSKILALDTLRGKIGNSDFDVSLKYYFKGVDRYDNKVANSLIFNSTFLDVDQLSAYDLAPKQGRSRRDTARLASVVAPAPTQHAKAFNIFIIPFSDFNAQINIGKLRYNRLWLTDVNARITMREDQTIAMDTLMLKIARGGGDIRMRGKFNGKDPDRISFRSRIYFDQVDLEKVLLKLDHFGQDVVVNKNIKGRLSGYIKSYVRVHPDMVPILDNSRAEMDMKIYNGTLVDFAPMQAMASYFKDKNLRLIRFDTLQNKLRFVNGVLEIPVMEINSSIGYIQMSGKQSLDLNMEYYLRVPLKIVTKAGFSSLFNRKQEEVDLSQIDEIEYVDRDKKIAFMNLKVTGTPDDFKVGLGKEKGKKI